MKFIESERGNQKLSYQGFLYIKQNNLANGVLSWEYEQRRRNSCNAKIKVRGEEVVGNVNTHHDIYIYINETGMGNDC
jgi:hypothetical protein